MAFGDQIEWFEEVSSTMEVAGAWAREGASEGLVIIAERQTAGRGRLHRDWFSPEGGLWLSILLRPALPPKELGLIGISFAVATAQAITNLTEVPVGVKWPNDLIASQKKIGGLLMETEMRSGQVDFAVLGMGINVNIPLEAFPKEIKTISTSLLIETGKSWPLDELAKPMLSRCEMLYRQLLAGERKEIIASWNELDTCKGRKLRVVQDSETIEGTAVGMNEQGALLVQSPRGIVVLGAGEVEWL